MLKFVPNKTGLWLTTSLVVIGALFYTLSSFLLQDQILTIQLRNNLQKNLKKNGLHVNLSNIHWSGWGSFKCSQVSLVDPKKNQVLAQAEAININLDLIALLVNRGHVERALKKVELIDPSVSLKRYSDGTWDLQKYFPKTGRKMRLEATFIVKNGTFSLDDETYGKHHLSQINGKVQFNPDETLGWNCEGISDFCQELRWNSHGNATTNFKIGQGEISVDNLLLSKITPLLQKIYPVKIFNGIGQFALNFAWDNGQFHFKNGLAVLKDTRVKVPNFNEILNIKEFDGVLSPAELRVNQARIGYQGSLINISGQLLPKSATVKATVSGDRIRLADLYQVIPGLQRYQLEGSADLKVVISGTLDHPVLDGRLTLNKAGIVINKDLKINEISGQAKIIQNNLEINKMEGLLGKALVGVGGKILNIFAPRFELNLFGQGLTLAEVGLAEPAGLELPSTIDFDGKITGELWTPVISGELQTAQLEYKEISAKNVRAIMAWEVALKNFHLSKVTGEIGAGSILAEGAIKINPKGVEWKLSGDLVKVELGAVKFCSPMGIEGRVSTHALLKGKWKRGEAFDPGLILGTFKGENFSNQEVHLKDIQGVYSWEKNKLVIDSIQASAGQGRIYGHLAWDTAILAASFNAEHIAISDLIPDIKKYPFGGIIDGSFDFEGPLSDLKGKIQGSIKQATYLSKPVGEIVGSLEYADQGIKINSLLIASDTGDYSIDGMIDWKVEPTIAITVKSDNLNLEGFNKWLPINQSLPLKGIGALTFELTGLVSDPTYTGVIQLDNPSLGDFRMEHGTVQLEGDFQEICLNQVEFNDGISSIVASGKVNRDALDLNLTGSQIDLDYLGLEYDGKKLQGWLDLRGKLIGKPSAPVLSVDISPGSLVFGPFAGNIISGNVTLKDQKIQLSRVKLDGEDFKLNIYGAIDIAQPLMVDLEFNVVDLNFAKLLQVFNGSQINAAGKLGGLLKITGNPLQPEIRFYGELTDATMSSVPFYGELALIYQQNRLSIEQLKLWQSSGELVASGVWEVGSTINFQVKTTGFSLETFNSLLPSGYQLAGAINLDTNIAWSGSGISGELQAVVDEIYLNQNRLGDLRLKGRFMEQGLSVDESVLEAKEGSVIAQGHLPWPEGFLSKIGMFNNLSRGLHLELTFKDTPVMMANSYLPKDITVTSGSLNGRLNLYGAYRWPLLSGRLVASRVGIATPLLPLPVERVRMFLNINHNKMMIQRARGEYGDGKFTFDGETWFFGEEDQLHYSLNFEGSNLYYHNDYYEGYSNLALQLTGTSKNSKLSGDIDLFESRIGLLKMGKKETSSLKWNPSFDLQVKAGKNVRYRQVGLADVAFRGNLRIKGDLKQPLISGEVNSTKGVLNLYGQTFKINKAKAVFKYSQGIYPYIDLDSSVLTPKAEVFLAVKGQIGDDLSIKLYSYPSLPEDDLFALLNWSELRGDKPLSLEGVATTNLNIVTDTMFGEVFYELRQALHLDYLYLVHDYTEDEFRINAGDYVSNRLFLSYSRSVSNEPKEKWGLDYHLTSNLTAGGNYSIEDGTTWRLTYRFRF